MPVTGAVTVSAAASDNVGVTKVQFTIDGVVMAINTAAPWGFTWTIAPNSAQSAPGNHVVMATAFDAAGNTSSASVSVSIAAIDTTPPTVSIVSPANGSPVAGAVTVSASASDNVGVTRVDFSVDGVLAAALPQHRGPSTGMLPVRDSAVMP